MTYNSLYHIFHDWLCHLATFIIILVHKRWSSDKANREKYAINYQGVKKFFDKVTFDV